MAVLWGCSGETRVSLASATYVGSAVQSGIGSCTIPFPFEKHIFIVCLFVHLFITDNWEVVALEVLYSISPNEAKAQGSESWFYVPQR